MLMWSAEVVFTHCSHHTVTLMFVRRAANERLIKKMLQVSSVRDRLLYLEGCCGACAHEVTQMINAQIIKRLY